MLVERAGRGHPRHREIPAGGCGEHVHTVGDRTEPHEESETETAISEHDGIFPNERDERRRVCSPAYLRGGGGTFSSHQSKRVAPSFAAGPGMSELSSIMTPKIGRASCRERGCQYG